MQVQVEGLWEVCLASPFYGEQPEILGYVSGQFKIDAEEQAALTYAETHRKPNNIIFVRPANITQEIPSEPPPPPPPMNVWERLRHPEL